MTQSNNKNNIEPNTGNYNHHYQLLHKNISGLIGDRVNKLDSEERTSSPRHSSYWKQKCKEVTENNQDISKAIVVDVQNLKIKIGKDIESESIAVKDET